MPESRVRGALAAEQAVKWPFQSFQAEALGSQVVIT